MQSNNKLEAGWNDPPNFSYSESIQYSKSPKRNLLNKRVAFPLNSTNSSQPSIVDPTATINFNPNLPPPPSSSAVSSGENFLENSNTSCNDESINTKVRFDDNFSSSVMDDESRLNEVLKNLNDVIEIQNGLASSHNIDENFKKKLLIMEESWTNKLSDDIKKKLYLLSIALKNKDERTADKIHVSLMVDHPKICSEFISVFRQLLNRMKLDSANDTEEESS